MSPEDLKLYALSDASAPPMVRMVALERITLEGCTVLEDDGDLTLKKGSDPAVTGFILRGQMFACEPDLAAMLHCQGSALIERPPPEVPAPAAPTAPRVRPEDIEAEIAGEHYFTAAQGVDGACYRIHDPNDRTRLSLVTICVLELSNGCVVLGKSVVISPENFDAAKGREIARKNAIDQIWPLLGFRLLDRLAGTEAARIAELEAVCAEQDRRLAAINAARYL
jgi:hypothetical protein